MAGLWRPDGLRRYLTGVLAVTLVSLGLVSARGSTSLPSKRTPAAVDTTSFAPGDVLASSDSEIRHHSADGTFLGTLPGIGGVVQSGLCLDKSSNLYVGRYVGSSSFFPGLSKYDSTGALVGPAWATTDKSVSSCAVDASGNVYAGAVDFSTIGILKFDPQGLQVASYSPQTTASTTSQYIPQIAFGSDQCVIYYTTSSTTVKRFNVCTNSQLADVATGLPGQCGGLQVRTDGAVLVACGTAGVLLLDSTGSITRTYSVADLGLNQAFPLDLDTDGLSFWTGDPNQGTIVRVRISDKKVLKTIPLPLDAESPLHGLAIVKTGRPTRYVALGDSFSSGEGVSPFFQDGFDPWTHTQPGNLDNKCHRSTRAYAEFVGLPGFQGTLYSIASGGGDPGNNNKYHSDSNVRTRGSVAWVFWACSGADTTNVLPESEGGVPQSRQDRNDREQFTQLDNPSVNSETSLLTITIGGIDIGFRDILTHCAFFPCNTPSYRTYLDTVIDGLKPKLVKVYLAAHARAPNARIIVLGYPQLFPQSRAEQECTKLRTFYGGGEQGLFRDETARLNGVIGDAVAEASVQFAGVQFKDVSTIFQGHEVCGNNGEWVNGPSFTARFHWGSPFLDDASFHPNLLGQLGYAIAVNSALAASSR